MFSEDDLLPISALQHLLFCERRAFLVHVERVWQENVSTVEGHQLHDRTHEAGTESRGDIRIARGLRLRSLTLGLSGMADVVEFHRVADGEAGAELPRTRGRWRPFPVEYKRGILRHEQAYEVQLCAQAMCLEEMLGTAVPAGSLFYGLSRRRQDVTQVPVRRRLDAPLAPGFRRRELRPAASGPRRLCRAAIRNSLTTEITEGTENTERRERRREDLW